MHRNNYTIIALTFVKNKGIDFEKTMYALRRTSQMYNFDKWCIMDMCIKLHD